VNHDPARSAKFRSAFADRQSARSPVTAALGELPLAAVLIVGTLRIARLQVPPFGRAWWPFPGRRQVVGVRPGPSGRSRRAAHQGPDLD